MQASMANGTWQARATVLGLAITLSILAVPRSAAAQSDAIRIMADRVLDNARGSVDRRGGNARDRYDRDDDRRDGDRWRREQRAREAWCRRNPRDRQCRDVFNNNRRGNNDAAWCWDRDRNGRCDNASSRRPHNNRGWAWGRR